MVSQVGQEPHAAKLPLGRDVPPADVVVRAGVRSPFERAVQHAVGRRKHGAVSAKDQRKDGHGVPVEGVTGPLRARREEAYIRGQRRLPLALLGRDRLSAQRQREGQRDDYPQMPSCREPVVICLLAHSPSSPSLPHGPHP